MKRFISIFLFTILFGIFNYTESQLRPDSVQLTALSNFQQKMNNPIGLHWNNKTGTPDIITFEKPHSYSTDPTTSAKLFLNEVKGLFKKSETDDKFVFKRVNKDSSIQYIHFEQSYKNIPVIGGNYVITVLPGGKVQSALGNFHKDISISITPKFTVDQAFISAKENSPKNLKLVDSLISSGLIVYPKDSSYFLAWELRIPTSQKAVDWIYIINASDGKILSSQSTAINEVYSQANVYLHHPSIDASYTHISPINDNRSGYLQGTYANVVNDETSRAYSSIYNFAYSPSNTHFDEANLFYQIDNFRRDFWNEIGFNAFSQITVHAHTYFSDGPNAMYAYNQLWFSDGQGVSGFNSFAKEDKVIMHEYTHAVTDYIAHFNNPVYDGYNETYAIDEGNSDYYAASYTGRTLIGEYCCSGYPRYQRDLSNPRIANYTDYTGPEWGYPRVEPHDGGELWSASLWDLRKSGTGVGQYYADMLTYKGLFGIPANSSFLQYREAIINADKNYYNGSHVSTIRHVFYLRGIGADNLSVSISGPSSIYHPAKGNSPTTYTWNADVSGGASPFNYSWYWDGSYVGSGSSYSRTLYYAGNPPPTQRTLKVTVTDGSSQSVSANKSITEYYDVGFPKISANQEQEALPDKFFIRQNYPNPFNPTTTISYQLPKESHVLLSVYNTLGKEVATLVNEYKEPGYYNVSFDATNLPSGLYFYRMQAGKFTDVRKMLLMK